MEKKYQIFISSTYTDLKEERQKVIDAILKMYHIPIGMEMFSAADEAQWETIKKTIDTSDYYVVIIGFRYGSETDEGISYTEKEYDYAVSKGIPVLAFIKDRNSLTKPDEMDINQKKINKFIKKLENKMRETWINIDDLSYKVTTSLYKQFIMNPQEGWVKGTKEKKEIEYENIRLKKEDLDKMFKITHKYEISEGEFEVFGVIENISNITTCYVAIGLYFYNKNNEVYNIEETYVIGETPFRQGQKISFDFNRYISKSLDMFSIGYIEIEVKSFVDYNTEQRYMSLI